VKRVRECVNWGSALRGFGVAVTVSVACLLAASALAAGGVTHFEARSKPRVYLLFTVSHGKVTEARWSLRETCEQSAPESNSGDDVLNAPIRNGQFHKTVTQTHGNPGVPNGGWTDTTSFKGTIAGQTATVKVTDNLFVASTSPCYGSHTFAARAAVH
jgi:hypothetical protein